MLDRNWVYENFEFFKSNQLNQGRVGASIQLMDEFYKLETIRRHYLSQRKYNESDQLDEIIHNIELQFANIKDHDVPIGTDSNDNVVVKTWGTPTQFTFEPLSHIALGENLDILDFQRADKTSNHMACFYKGLGARLERAVLNYMLYIHITENGYEEMIPPYYVNAQSMYHSSLYPQFSNEVFRFDSEDLALITSAEVPVENYYSGEVIEEFQLPIKIVSSSPCFRVEHGDCIA